MPNYKADKEKLACPDFFFDIQRGRKALFNINREKSQGKKGRT